MPIPLSSVRKLLYLCNLDTRLVDDITSGKRVHPYSKPQRYGPGTHINKCLMCVAELQGILGTKVNFDLSNDAPRKGQVGQYVQIIIDEKMIAVVPELAAYVTDPSLVAKYAATIDAMKTGVI